jgi:hypothetical protein
MLLLPRAAARHKATATNSISIHAITIRLITIKTGFPIH